MRKLLDFASLSIICLSLLGVPPAQGGYLLVKDVLSESGGHAESVSFLLDHSVGQVAVGQSVGTGYTEWGGFWGWSPRCLFVPVEEEETPGILPPAYVLHQNYPNPFNPQTHISYRLPEAGSVSLIVFNVTGQVVRRLVDEHQDPGDYTVTWDGTDEMRRPVTSGVYFYQLTAGKFRQMRKMLLLK